MAAKNQKTSSGNDSKATKAKSIAIAPPKTKKKVTPVQLLRHVCIFFSAFGTLLLAVLINQPITWCSSTYGNLIGEELLDSHEKARDYADRSIEEAYALWSEPKSNWKIMYDNRRQPGSNQLVVECRRVTEGPFVNSTIYVARSEGILRGVSAQEAYDFIVSPEGFAILDRASGAEHFGKPFEVIPDWREGSGKTQLEESYVPALGPFMAQRHFVVLNSFLPEEQIFVSKSVAHKSRPGASSYYQGEFSDEKSNNKAVRALNTLGVKVESKALENGENVVSLKMINYADMQVVPEALMNYLSCKMMFPGLYEKFQKALSKRNDDVVQEAVLNALGNMKLQEAKFG